MKATLEFDLPEEEWEHYAAVKGRDALLLLHDLWMWLIDVKEKEGKRSITIKKFMDKINSFAEGYTIDFWNIP